MVFIYTTIKIRQPFLNFSPVPFLLFFLKFMEIISMTAFDTLLDPIDSFKTLKY